MAIEKIKILVALLELPAKQHLPQNWAKLAVLFSWLLQKGSQDFDFFNCHWCRIFILCEIHCYFCPQIFWVYYFSLSQCEAKAKSHNHRPYHYPPFSPGKDRPYYIYVPYKYNADASLLASFTQKKDEAKKLTRHIFLIISCASQGNLKLFPYFCYKVLWKFILKSSNHPQIILKLTSNHPQIIPKSILNHPQIIFKSSSNYHKTAHYKFSLWPSQNIHTTKIVPIQIILKSSSTNPPVILKLSCYPISSSCP